MFGWWTELEPSGYVGRSLKRITVVSKSPEHAVVNTEWSYFGRRFTMPEELFIDSPTRWVWHSSFLGIPAVETFTLSPLEDGCVLTIRSEMKPSTLARKVLFLLVGWNWRREDRKEWETAFVACERELAQAPK